MRLSHEPDVFLQHDAFVLSDDPERYERDELIGLLKQADWMIGETDDAIRKSLDHTHIYALQAPGGSLAGCVTILSDQVFNARLSNLFITELHRGRGLGRWILSMLLERSSFRHVRTWQLIADEAQNLYRHFGFKVFEGDNEFMLLRRNTQ